MEATAVVDFLLWALEHGVTIGLVAFLLAIPLALLGVAYLWFLQGARTIAAGWVWVQLFRWLRDRRTTGARSPFGHPGGAGGYSREYAAFFSSAAWARQRARVLRRDGHRCQACGGRRGLAVHHTWYATPIEATPDWALTTLCHATCHLQGVHGRG
jgi:hypothetical protein